ncbi:hypothetical protein WJX79_001847 [Trebouxia sp. C0005]
MSNSQSNSFYPHQAKTVRESVISLLTRAASSTYFCSRRGQYSTNGSAGKARSHSSDRADSQLDSSSSPGDEIGDGVSHLSRLSWSRLCA